MKKFILFALGLFFLNPTVAQLKSPEEFLGYALGSQFTRHHQVVDYFQYVDKESDQMHLIQYGETYEKRPLYLAFIASPENYGKLEEIRQNQLAAARMTEGDAGTQEVAVVWLSYNVHGNESVSTEVSMRTLFELLNPKNAETKKWLENTVVIIDPCINPDGRERYVNWYYQKANLPYNKDPDASEHHEPWPRGRANHYLFDLNRDWAWASQIESQHRLKQYNQWMPHVHVDFHEQGVDSPYYFAPAAEPYHAVVTDFQRSFQKTIGENHAKYFDDKGWLYFTKEVFDLLYPSYGDTYPTFNGAIGMTYEQGGSGRAGLGILNAEGEELTLKDRIEHHFTTSMSTVEVASNNAQALIENFEKYFADATNGKSKGFRSYVVKNDNEDKIESLRTLLERHHIAYGSVESSREVKGFDYAAGQAGRMKLEAHDLVINTDQPKANFIQALFEPKTQLSDSLTYDITAWSLPYARGLKTMGVDSKISTVGWTEKPVESTKLLTRPYAYLSKWNSVEDARFLSALLEEKIKVRFTSQAMTVNGQQHAAGTLLITRAGNGNVVGFDEKVRKLADLHGRNITTVSTGLVSSGNDFGSNKVTYIDKPKVALLSGDPVSSLNFGAIWHFFEQQIGYQVQVIESNYFDRIDWHDYDVLILPEGWYGSFLTDARLAKINAWVKQGGNLIAIGRANSYLADKEGFGLSVYASEEDKKAADGLRAKRKESKSLRPYEEQERLGISDLITGSIFKVSLDASSPLGLGYDKQYYTLKTNNLRFAYLKNGSNVSTLERSSAQVSGFAGAHAKSGLDSTLVYGVEPIGKGNAIYLVDDPMFRSFWENGKLLFCNAVFLVGQ